MKNRFTSVAHARVSRGSCALVAAILLAGCAATPSSDPGIHDPLEPMNRAVHGVNKGLDRAIVGPVAKGYGTVVPEPVRQGVSNVADVLDLPGTIVNNLLQADVEYAAINSLRLGVNLTFGLGGLVDAATAFGMPEKDADFGQTLAVWGVGEGAYVELPLKGPSTARDAVGTVVDMAMNPVGNWLDGDDAAAATAAQALALLNDRYRYSGTLESILYDSADSYAQARLLYLQNRRFELGQQGTGAAGDGAADDGFIDPYED